MPNSLFSSDHTDHSSQAAGHLNPIEEKKRVGHRATNELPFLAICPHRWHFAPVTFAPNKSLYCMQKGLLCSLNSLCVCESCWIGPQRLSLHSGVTQTFLPLFPTPFPLHFRLCQRVLACNSAAFTARRRKDKRLFKVLYRCITGI